MSTDYDSSWDLAETENGYTPESDDAFERKFAEWEERDWMTWLEDVLSFPFMVERVEDHDDAYFTDVAEHEPFRLGHEMKVVEFAEEDELYGIIVKVREGRRVGYVPLCDLEVIPKEDVNYWPVREYVVWFANR